MANPFSSSLNANHSDDACNMRSLVREGLRGSWAWDWYGFLKQQATVDMLQLHYNNPIQEQLNVTTVKHDF
jgi:hypothetical protein